MIKNQTIGVVLIAVIAVSILGFVYVSQNMIQPADEVAIRKDLNLQGPIAEITVGYHITEQLELTWTWYHEAEHESYLMVGDTEIAHLTHSANEHGLRSYTYLVNRHTILDELFEFHVVVGLTQNSVELGDVHNVHVIVKSTP